VKTNNRVTKIRSINFEFLDQSSFESLPQNIRELTYQLPNISSADGFLLGKKLDGSNLSIVAYFLESFPYEKKISFHILSLSENASYLSTLSILYSYIFICNQMHVNSLISRHTIDQLDTLLMSLSLDFHVIEFSRYSIPNIVVEKKFILNNTITKEDDYISVFNKNFANKEIKINSSQIDFKISDSISNLNAFSRFLNIEYDQFPNTFEELDRLCKKQNNISGTRIGKRNKTYYFIENNNIVGALMCPKKVRSRRILKSVFKILLNCRSQVIYTNIHDDWINSVLFLAGFILANKSNQQDSLLWKWERLL